MSAPAIKIQEFVCNLLAHLNLICQFFVKIVPMFARSWLTTPAKAVAATALLLLAMTACQSPPPKPPKPPEYSEIYDRQIKEILGLANQNRWEDAEAKSKALLAQDPKNPILIRINAWVQEQTQQRRSEALEDKIRSIDAKNSPFNPTVKSLLTEQKDRGLDPRKDVRDAVEHIENAPYIPDTYGKTIREQGPLFDFESAKGRMSKVLEKEVTIHLDNVPLETILVNLSQSAGVNIVADKSLVALKQLLSVNLDKVKLGEFLRYIGRNYDLQFQVGDELVWVVDGKDPKKLMEETRFYRLRKGFVLPAQLGSEDAVRQEVTAANNVKTVTETQKFRKFVNDEAPATPSLEKAIKELWTGSKYIIDYERNLVVARGTPEQLDVMERIIKEFDQPIQQVLIEARFITISKPAFMQLGILWESDRQGQSVNATGTSVPQDFTGLVNGQNFPNIISANPAIAGANPAVGIGIQNAFTHVFNANNLTATLSALEQSGESQTLSAPRLTVLNNRPATISDGLVQYYYEEYTVAQTVQQYYTASSWVPSGKPSKITAGAILNVLASISGDGKSILLALNPVVNTDVQLVKYATLSQYGVGTNVQSTFDIKLPQYRTEELATRVVVKSGQTVVMGGVLERERATYVESVPVLGDIPLIGVLFRRRTEVDTPRYLLIFVTASIVRDTGEFLVYEEEHASGTNSVAAPK
jgi:type IV pilus assembly protein PilQ